MHDSCPGLPRIWSRIQFKQVLWFRRGLPGKARDFNWHNVFGVWALVPLFFIVLTALPMSYPWANDLVYKMTKALFENADEIAVGHPKGSELDPEYSVASISIPLHPGAEKYYKEIGVLE